MPTKSSQTFSNYCTPHKPTQQNPCANQVTSDFQAQRPPQPQKPQTRSHNTHTNQPSQNLVPTKSPQTFSHNAHTNQPSQKLAPTESPQTCNHHPTQTNATKSPQTFNHYPTPSNTTKNLCQPSPLRLSATTHTHTPTQPKACANRVPSDLQPPPYTNQRQVQNPFVPSTKSVCTKYKIRLYQEQNSFVPSTKFVCTNTKIRKTLSLVCTIRNVQRVVQVRHN